MCIVFKKKKKEEEKSEIRKYTVHTGEDEVGKLHFPNAVQGALHNRKAWSLAQSLLPGLPTEAWLMSEMCKKPAHE